MRSLSLSSNKALLFHSIFAVPEWSRGKATHSCRSRKCPRERKCVGVSASLEIQEFSPNDFAVERLIGTLGFMNVASSSGSPFGSGMVSGWGSASDSDSTAAGFGLEDLNRMASQSTSEGSVKIRIYKGRIVTPGRRLGTRVLMKSYPSPVMEGGRDADAMAANELKIHSTFQSKMREYERERGQGDGGRDELLDCANHLSVLLGGFQTRTGENWLIFRDDGVLSAVDYCRLAAEATARNVALGEGEFWDSFDRLRPIRRRHVYMLKLMRGLMKGVLFLHACGIVHQSMGPASVLMNPVDERDVRYLVPRIKDFAFAIDVSDPASLMSASPSSLRGGLGSEGESDAVSLSVSNLWRKAEMNGAFSSPLSRRAYGLADDIYACGLLLGYLSFLPLCPKDAIDGPSLQRLFEVTFRLDVSAVRDYCAEDERWTEAVRFLDMGQGAGWDLLQLMMNPDYRLRPSADAVLQHPFLKGDFLTEL